MKVVRIPNKRPKIVCIQPLRYDIGADGHPVTGDVQFRLTRPGTGKPITPAVAASASGGGGMPIWVWIVAAVVVLGAVLFFVLRSGGPKEESGR